MSDINVYRNSKVSGYKSKHSKLPQKEKKKKNLGSKVHLSDTPIKQKTGAQNRTGIGNFRKQWGPRLPN